MSSFFQALCRTRLSALTLLKITFDTLRLEKSLSSIWCFFLWSSDPGPKMDGRVLPVVGTSSMEGDDVQETSSSQELSMLFPSKSALIPPGSELMSHELRKGWSASSASMLATTLSDASSISPPGSLNKRFTMRNSTTGHGSLADSSSLDSFPWACRPSDPPCRTPFPYRMTRGSLKITCAWLWIRRTLPNKIAAQNPEYRTPSRASRLQMKFTKKQFVGLSFWYPSAVYVLPYPTVLQDDDHSEP